eukprot:TRINITY_DN50716_c0_g1_i1.p1 TRINITY_DN50716_c0_g1~~TRINITY_DN50716_c0_g1_i1.p1  ORF type:complete len:1289 (+),score=232.89 TRINITY_DN50716_c0_g1_i1:109-3867(+)
MKGGGRRRDDRQRQGDGGWGGAGGGDRRERAREGGWGREDRGGAQRRGNEAAGDDWWGGDRHGGDWDGGDWNRGDRNRGGWDGDWDRGGGAWDRDYSGSRRNRGGEEGGRWPAGGGGVPDGPRGGGGGWSARPSDNQSRGGGWGGGGGGEESRRWPSGGGGGEGSRHWPSGGGGGEGARHWPSGGGGEQGRPGSGDGRLERARGGAGGGGHAGADGRWPAGGGGEQGRRRGPGAGAGEAPADSRAGRWGGDGWRAAGGGGRRGDGGAPGDTRVGRPDRGDRREGRRRGEGYDSPGQQPQGPAEVPSQPSVVPSRLPVVLLQGLPGSGKTTLGEGLARELPADFFHTSEQLRIYNEARQKAQKESALFTAAQEHDTRKPWDNLRAFVAALGGWLDERCRDPAKRCLVLDFSPRHHADIMYLGHELAARGLAISLVLELQCGDAVLEQRVRSRGREGDDAVRVQVRQHGPFVASARAVAAAAGERRRVLDGERTPQEVLAGALEEVRPLLAEPFLGFPLPDVRSEAPCLRPVRSGAELVCVLDAMAAAASGAGCRSHFPGSMVSGALVMRDDGLQNPSALPGEPLRPHPSTHVASLKLDGTRFLLLHFPDQQGKEMLLRLVPRSMDVAYAFECWEATPAVPQQQKSAPGRRAGAPSFIVDGELLEERGTGACLFVAFDILYLEGSKLRMRGTAWTLARRLRELESLQWPPLNRVPSPPPGRVALCLKEYHELHELERLAAVDEQGRFRCPTDGLMFTPKDRYRDGVDTQLVKWKPPRHLTCDFELAAGEAPGKGGEVECRLMAKGDKGLTEAGTITLPAVQARRLDGAIVECRITDHGWRFVRERTDKTTANQLQVVELTRTGALGVPLEAIAELAQGAASPMITGRDRDVAQHYDQAVHSSVEKRHHTWVAGGDRPDLALNNWIKMALVLLFPQGARVLDVGSGRGGDQSKIATLAPGGVSAYVAIDIAPAAVAHAKLHNEKAAEKKAGAGLPAAFCVGSMTDPQLPARLERRFPGLFFDVTWCQMALHYSCSSEAELRTTLRLCASRLVAGGLFMVTTVDSDVVQRLARETSTPTPHHLRGRRIGTAHDIHVDKGKIQMRYSIELSHRAFEACTAGLRGDASSFGLSYRFSLLGAVEDCEEFLADRAAVERVAREEGLELDRELSLNFNAFKTWALEHHPQRDECRRLADRAALLGGECLGHADGWRMTPKDREVSGLYTVMVFRRVGGERAAPRGVIEGLPAADIVDLTRD